MKALLVVTDRSSMTTYCGLYLPDKYIDRLWIGKVWLSFRGEDCLFVSCFNIAEDYQGKGYGTQMMRQVVRFARNKGCTRLRLLVDKKNYRGIKFYEKFGFVKQEVVDYGGTPCHEMVKRLRKKATIGTVSA